MNMSYCRFHNTLSDLYDCQAALEDYVNNDDNCISKEELVKAKRLIEVCREIADNYTESDLDFNRERYEAEEQEEENE